MGIGISALVRIPENSVSMLQKQIPRIETILNATIKHIDPMINSLMGVDYNITNSFLWDPAVNFSAKATAFQTQLENGIEAVNNIADAAEALDTGLASWVGGVLFGELTPADAATSERIILKLQSLETLFNSILSLIN